MNKKTCLTPLISTCAIEPRISDKEYQRIEEEKAIDKRYDKRRRKKMTFLERLHEDYLGKPIEECVESLEILNIEKKALRDKYLAMNDYNVLRNECYENLHPYLIELYESIKQRC